MDKLLTTKDLAVRWQVSERTINEYKAKGIIVPVKGLPIVRYNMQYIEQIEGNIPEKVTMREKKLQRELEDIRKERDFLKGILANILAESTKIASIINE